MADKTLLDTDIFSELMRDKNDAVRARADSYLEQHGRLTISMITVLEIVKGLQKAARKDTLSSFLDSLPAVEILTVGPAEAILAGRIYGELERLG